MQFTLNVEEMEKSMQSVVEIFQQDLQEFSI